MKALLIVPVAAVAGCNAVGGSQTVEGSQVQPGLASCLATIGRPDVAVDPAAPMSDAEINALLACTSERAAR